jgi:hypothetical protein
MSCRFAADQVPGSFPARSGSGPPGLRRRAEQFDRQGPGREGQPVPAQPVTEQLPPLFQPALEQTDGPAELPGGLVAGQPLQAAQHQRGRVLTRQPGQLLIEDPLRMRACWLCHRHDAMRAPGTGRSHGAILPKPPSGKWSGNTCFHRILVKSLQGIGAWVQYKSENRNWATRARGHRRRSCSCRR